MEAQHETSTSTEWSNSLTTSVSAGFEAKAFSFSAEVSQEVSKTVANSVTDSISTSQAHEIQFEYTDAHIGKTLWQFEFETMDSCYNEETISLREMAFTEGADPNHEPCCAPGWASDAPAYTQCYAGGLISDNPFCTVVGENDEYLRLARGSCPIAQQVSKDDCLAAAIAVGADASKTHLDGGNDSGYGGRPQGCTMHDNGNVEWWGPSDNAPCGNLNYNCVCKTAALV
jgi:hypothetical protein